MEEEVEARKFRDRSSCLGDFSASGMLLQSTNQ